MDKRRIKNFIINFIQEKKGYDIVVLDLKQVTTIADYFIICTGSVPQHVKSIADNVIEKMEEKGFKSWHIEGKQAQTWILIDYVDIVVHIFTPETREFYRLEKLWADAKRTDIKNLL